MAEAKISLVMIAKDEEAFIGDSLKSVAGLVDEVIVVDTGSRDSTPRIAENLGARVYRFPWNDDFSAARNFSIEKATGSWLIFLDADETISRSDIPRIKRLTGQEKYEAFKLIQRNYLVQPSNFADWQPNDGVYRESRGYAGWIPVAQVRLWRNRPEYKFEGIVHETLDRSIEAAGGLIQVTDIPIHHYGRVRSDRPEKIDFCLALGLKEIERRPDNFKPYYEIGLIYLGRRQIDRAIQYLEKALSLSNLSYRLLSDLGYAYIQKGEFTKALDCLKQAIKLNPDGETAYLNLGVMFFHAGDLEFARINLEKAREIHPARAQTHYNLGAVAFRRGNYAEAEDHLLRALELEPGNREALLLLAGVMKTAGKPAAAYEILKKADRFHPNDPEIIFNTGLIQEEMGLVKDALENYRLLLKKWPETASKVLERLEAIKAKNLSESEQQ